MSNIVTSSLQTAVNSAGIQQSKAAKTYDYLRGAESNIAVTSPIATPYQHRDNVLNGVPIGLPGTWYFRILSGLPKTKYKVFFKDINVTTQSQQVGKKYGVDYITTDESGRVEFFFYFGANISPKNLWEELKLQRELEQKRKSIRIAPYSMADSVIGSGQDETSQTSSSNRDKSLTYGNGVRTIQPTTGIDPYVVDASDSDLIQTFYLDSAQFDNAATVHLSKIELYFRQKPLRDSNRSGIASPGVTVEIIDIESDGPVTNKIYADSFIMKDWEEIIVSADATTPTIFGFNEPLQLKTNRFYGIAITWEDDDYILWYAKIGDALVGTNTPCPSPSNRHDGVVYQRNNSALFLNTVNTSDSYRSLNNIDLKFDVYVAQFKIKEFDLDIVPLDYEFLTLADESTTSFIGGELVYQETDESVGTISIIAGNTLIVGTNTAFLSDGIREGDFIVITDGTDGNTDIVQILNIRSDTSMQLSFVPTFTAAAGVYKVAPLGTVYLYERRNSQLYISQSTAAVVNSTPRVFVSNGAIIGVQSGATATIDSVDDFQFNAFLSDMDMNTPSLVRKTTTYKFANTTYNLVNQTSKILDWDLPNHIADYQPIIASRSYEVQNGNNLHNPTQAITGLALTLEKSAQMTMSFTHQKANTFLFETPVIRGNGLTFLTSKWDINNDSTNEHTRYGSARSKHISNKLTLLEGRSAEDLKVYATVYRPRGTSIKFYAKIFNTLDPEAYDDKFWTEMEIIDGANKYSSSTNKDNVFELGYGLPLYPTSNATLDGSITTTASSKSIVGNGTEFMTDLAEGSVIKIYSPIFPENYFITSVDSIASNVAMTISEVLPSNSLIGDGFKIDTLTTPYTAFRQSFNFSAVRYFNSVGTQFDSFNIVSVKIVLLSESQYLVPYVDDYRLAAVSA